MDSLTLLTLSREPLFDLVGCVLPLVAKSSKAPKAFDSNPQIAVYDVGGTNGTQMLSSFGIS
jgi:hypothetical protein